MAASSDQPINVGNLAAALEGVGGETVLFSDKDNTSKSVTLSEPMENFDLLTVTVRYGVSRSVYYATATVFVSDLGKDAMFACPQYGNYSAVSVTGSGTTLSESDASAYRIARVTGIKTGGGQLLAKLLRDLCKGVA